MTPATCMDAFIHIDVFPRFELPSNEPLYVLL